MLSNMKRMYQMNKLLITRKELCEEYCHISAPTLKAWERSGKLKPVNLNPLGKKLYRREDVERLFGIKKD